MKLPSGDEMTNLSPEQDAKMKRNAQCFSCGGVLVTPGKMIVPKRFADHCQQIYDFKTRPSDVFVKSYLKTGSTWMQEIVWAVLHNSDLDHPDAPLTPYIKAPFFDTDAVDDISKLPAVLFTRLNKNNVDTVLKSFEFLDSPRVFKSHLHFSVHSPEALNTAKFVYVIRNPTDTCLSYYHFARCWSTLSYVDSFEDFVEDFLDGNYYFGSYLDHLRQWWAIKDNPQVHTVFYEELLRDTTSELKRLCRFLGRDLTDQQLENVRHYASFEEMKKRDPLEKEDMKNMYKEGESFFRTGKSGAAKIEMSPGIFSKINEHFKKNLGDIILPYDFNAK